MPQLCTFNKELTEMSNLVQEESGSSVMVAPLQWSRLKHINDVEPLNHADAECLAEIREVLKRHGKLERLGIALLHSHFPLADDEVMLEETDEDARLQTLKPMKRSEVGDYDVGTIWQLRDGVEAMAWGRSYCKRPTLFTGHTRGHKKTK